MEKLAAETWPDLRTGLLSRTHFARVLETGFAARDVEAEEREAKLLNALEDAESFIEQVETWSGSDPDEVHEALADIRAAVSSTEIESGEMTFMLVIAVSLCIVTAAWVLAVCRMAKIGDEQIQRRPDARPE